MAKAAKNNAGIRQLTWLLAWAVVFCDIGTSVYYVPGILYNFVGDYAPFFVLLVSAGFVLIALKYIEVVQRAPRGGGVVTIGEMAFGGHIGALGGMFITVDFFLTGAISSTSGFYYLASVVPNIEANVPWFACLGLMFLAIVNIIGIRESATLSLVMATASLVTNLAVVAMMLIRLDAAQWRAVLSVFDGVGTLTAHELLVGFAAAWLAFSGLESISQLAPVMREPVKRTARWAMLLVIVTILITSPLLTLLSIGVLPAATKAAHSERFISELAAVAAGLPLKVAVIATAASLLLFAANTAIIGAYHVFLALAERNYFPRRLMTRNRQFNTPHWAILVATGVPLAVILVTRGHMTTLGDMYAFGLLGAFCVESGGVDVLRWRDRQRGFVFWVGLVPTGMVILAWTLNIVEKPAATAFGGTLATLGMLYGLGLHEGWIKEALHQIPAVSRRSMEAAVAGDEQASEAVPQIVSLKMAQEIKPLYKSSTLVAVRGRNPNVVAEGIRRAKGMGETALYCIYVEEWPGLFYEREGLLPSEAGIEALTMAARQAALAGIELIPIWTTSYSTAEGIARAARELEVSGVLIGVTRRSALYRLFRGQVVKRLARRMPAHCRLIICD